MHKTIQISVIGALALTALLVTASTFAPAALAYKHHHHHHHHHGVSIHQSIHQDQSCAFANCQQNAANVAQVGHDNSATVTQANFH
jgi:hypothetical protein